MPAYILQRSRQAALKLPATKVRSYNSTIKGAETITSLVAMPTRHATTAAICQRRGAGESTLRMKQ